MSPAEYYYIDKGAKRPLKLLSDTVALRPKDGLPTKLHVLDHPLH